MADQTRRSVSLNAVICEQVVASRGRATPARPARDTQIHDSHGIANYRWHRLPFAGCPRPNQASLTERF
jgi:hypothetical protein